MERAPARSPDPPSWELVISGKLMDIAEAECIHTAPPAPSPAPGAAAEPPGATAAAPAAAGGTAPAASATPAVPAMHAGPAAALPLQVRRPRMAGCDLPEQMPYRRLKYGLLWLDFTDASFMAAHWQTELQTLRRWHTEFPRLGRFHLSWPAAECPAAAGPHKRSLARRHPCCIWTPRLSR